MVDGFGVDGLEFRGDAYVPEIPESQSTKANRWTHWVNMPLCPSELIPLSGPLGFLIFLQVQPGIMWVTTFFIPNS